MLIQIIDDKILSIQTTENKKNQRVPNGIIGAGSDGVGESFENLSIAAKLAKSKKPKLTKSKKLDLAKANSLEMDFLISEAKKTFIHL